MQPSTLFDDSFSFEFFAEDHTNLAATDQLYTARGSQAVGTVSKNIVKYNMIPNLDDYTSTLLMKNEGFGKYNVYYQKRVLWTLARPPDFFENHSPDLRQGYISLPILIQLTQQSMDGLIYFKSLNIRVYDSSDTDLIDAIARDLYDATGKKAILEYEEA